MQESRQPLFDAVETTSECLRIWVGVWRTLSFDRERFEEALRGDASLATELADLLAERGVPFREAHEAVGQLVRWCDENARPLDQVPREVAERIHPELAGDLSTWLDPRSAVERRVSLGGTAWSEVSRQVELLRETSTER